MTPPVGDGYNNFLTRYFSRQGQGKLIEATGTLFEQSESKRNGSFIEQKYFSPNNNKQTISADFSGRLNTFSFSDLRDGEFAYFIVTATDRKKEVISASMTSHTIEGGDKNINFKFKVDDDGKMIPTTIRIENDEGKYVPVSEINSTNYPGLGLDFSSVGQPDYEEAFFKQIIEPTLKNVYDPEERP